MSEISKVYITGGREEGGVRAYAKALANGFDCMGIQAIVIENPLDLIKLKMDWRNNSCMWILSTWALVFAPLMKNSVGVAHGWQLPKIDGLIKSLIVSSCLILCSKYSPIVAVSAFTAMQLRITWGVRSRKVIHNPLRKEFLDVANVNTSRRCITYVGRLIEIKQIHLLIDAFEKLNLHQDGYDLTIVGDGPLRNDIQQRLEGVPGGQYIRHLNAVQIKDLLLRTKIFYSGCLTEAFGISLLEAYACGATIVCPSVGGFVEVVLKEIGDSTFLFPPNGDGEIVASTVLSAIHASNSLRNVKVFSPENVAMQYLSILDYK